MLQSARQTRWFTSFSPRSAAAASWAPQMVFARPCQRSRSRLKRKLCAAMAGTATRTRGSTDAANQVWIPPMREADHADARAVHIGPGLEIVDGPPDVPYGVPEKRVLLLGRLGPPGGGDRVDVGLGSALHPDPFAVIAGVDGHREKPLGRQPVEPLALTLLGSTRAVQDQDRGTTQGGRPGGPHDQHRHALDLTVALLLRGDLEVLDGGAVLGLTGVQHLRIERDLGPIEQLGKCRPELRRVRSGHVGGGRRAAGNDRSRERKNPYCTHGPQLTPTRHRTPA